MLDNADRKYTSEEFLHIITECGQEEARRLLRICENDLELAVDMFFAEKVKVKVENEINTRVDVELENNLSLSEEVEKDDNSVLRSRPKKENVVSKLQRELKTEAVVINVSTSHPEIDIDYIRSLVQDFDGNELLVRDFLSKSETMFHNHREMKKDEMITGDDTDDIISSEVEAVADGNVNLELSSCKPNQVGNVSCKVQLTDDQQTSQEPGPKILTQAQDNVIDKCEVYYNAVPEHRPKQLWERVVGFLVLVGVCILIILLFCYAYDSEIITNGK